MDTFRGFIYVPQGLISLNVAFCPHSEFMCFVWIWEQTAIISLYSINWLVFITEMECIYCAVRTWPFYYIMLSLQVWMGHPPTLPTVGPVDLGVSKNRNAFSKSSKFRTTYINLLATDFFFQILAHPVFKMWVVQKPNKVALRNKRHFEEEKMEIIQHV